MNPLGAFDLHGKVAVITGAGSGIGRASAEVLAGAGATVVCADVVTDAADATAAGIVRDGGAAVGAAVDVTDSSNVESLVGGAVERYGRLDIMGNIAGIIVGGTVVDMTDADFEKVLAVNLKGVYYGCRAAARVMAAQGSGSIVNMASGAIDTPAPGLSGYGMAKAAVTQLTRVLATEVAGQGVRVNAIAPGFVLTGMTARLFTNPDGTVDEERKEAALAPMRRRTPLHDVGAPLDVAYAVLYLCSDAARFMTGQILRPNGGVAMPW
jgi:3-oxoacyl-[acyl-carrier protein] reductase